MRTHTLLVQTDSRRRYLNSQPKPVRQFWSLFKKNGPSTWSRVSDAAYSDVSIAYRVYGPRLIESCFELHVRMVQL